MPGGSTGGSGVAGCISDLPTLSSNSQVAYSTSPGACLSLVNSYLFSLTILEISHTDIILSNPRAGVAPPLLSVTPNSPT